ncbi:MAG: DUF1918 domain-containing protein [Acidimicrobiales bacterium]
MQAKPGDHLVVEGNKVGVPPRRGEVVEVLPGGDRYLIRWEPDQHESIFRPGPDAHLEH